MTYRVEIDCPPGVDVLDDDLAAEKLKLDGLESIGGDSSRVEQADGRTLRRFSYQLTTYRVDATSLKVAPFAVRYYVRRPGQRIEDAAPAGEVQVPGTVIALRSTLPDAPETYGIRDARTAIRRARVFSLVQPIGFALIVIAIAPVAFWGAAVAARRRARPARRSVRRVRTDERAALSAVRDLDLNSETSRQEAFTTIDRVLRGHLLDVCGVPGPSLTPEEAEQALAGRAGTIDPARVARVLAVCERARYAPPHELPDPDACRDALNDAEQVLAPR